ncbi:hypothetical protein HZ326_22754 [Fusarium oxysporum f. sp. albedinis]|nr:hypothetical protein HZ326_22754 [Fusarium oxysporum f. sp. albedinis]
MQYVLFHFKIKPIKPLPTYLQQQGTKPKIKRLMHGLEKMILGTITSSNWYSRVYKEGHIAIKNPRSNHK